MLVLVAMVGCAALTDAPADTGSREPAFPSEREAWRWPFASDSPWNVSVGDGLALLADGACTEAVQSTSVDAWVNAAEWSHPVHLAAASDPVVAIWEDDFAPVSVSFPEVAEPSLPAWPEGDAHLHLVDATGSTVTEMWQARPRSDGDWDVDSLAQNDLSGSGIGRGGVRIYGGSAVGGLWRTGEVEAGAWHALALSLPVDVLAPEFVWPATELSTSREDSMIGAVPVGQHVAIPQDVDEHVASTPAGRALLRTLRDYGAFVVDHASGFALYAEPGAEAEIDGMRSDIDLVRSLLQCSTNVSESAPGGPGARRRPDAPPLD